MQRNGGGGDVNIGGGISKKEREERNLAIAYYLAEK